MVVVWGGGSTSEQLELAAELLGGCGPQRARVDLEHADAVAIGTKGPRERPALHRLVETGNTVVVIEHNLDVIKTADWVIDLGPGGGVNGGRIVVEGTPETVAATKESFTGQYLKPLLERASVKPTVVEVAPKRPKRTRKVALDEDEPDLIAAK